MTVTDAEIVGSSLADPASFAVLFDRHADRVRRFATARVGASAADDVCAEAFRIAFEHRHRYSLDAVSALPWLLGITANLVRRELRSRSRGIAALERLGRNVALTTDATADGSVGRLDAERATQAVAAAVAALSEVEREVLLLVAWEHLTPAQAAQVLDVPAETARTRLHRARHHVREHLAHAASTEVSTDVR